jgi:hypothetical protein
MLTLVAVAMLVIGAGVLLALQWTGPGGRGWWNLALMIPAVAGFVAIMRTGTSRCEVELGAERIVVRSLDSSQLLGPSREVLYPWTDVVDTAWVGEDSDELRINFARAPRALVFSGIRRDLDALAAAVQARRTA